jgi:hypothetical protein
MDYDSGFNRSKWRAENAELDAEMLYQLYGFRRPPTT